MMKEIHGEKVYGTDVDANTGCAHYRSPLDIIAIKFKCCGSWFPCYQCHAENADHPPQAWSAGEFETLAILCGRCGYQLSVSEYFNSNSVCPNCASKFNPGCANHYHLYFEIQKH
jgi:uncharacterized CHY-type Zn-finger protein